MQKLFQTIFEQKATLVYIRFKEVASIYLQLKVIGKSIRITPSSCIRLGSLKQIYKVIMDMFL